MKGPPTPSQSSKKGFLQSLKVLESLGELSVIFKALKVCEKKGKNESLKVVKFDTSCQTDKSETDSLRTTI